MTRPATQQVPSEPGADHPLSRAMQAGGAVMAESANALARALDRFDSCEDALALLLAASGRVVVTGLGKSGLAGAKLAATFASTGTPSFFVHAADALHGDSGMVVEGDVLLAISNSGETYEVVTFARMVEERGVKVVAMTGCRGGSSLCRASDAVIDAAVDCEADPWDMVPTTSITVTLVVGDALAVAMMVARGFGPEQFHVHHPGGSLGRKFDAHGRQVT